MANPMLAGLPARLLQKRHCQQKNAERKKRHRELHLCAGPPPANLGIHSRYKNCMTRSLFLFQGFNYRDCMDNAQLAQHILGLSIAVAQQPYKVRAISLPLCVIECTLDLGIGSNNSWLAGTWHNPRCHASSWIAH
jgi:hypothetical protein